VTAKLILTCEHSADGHLRCASFACLLPLRHFRVNTTRIYNRPTTPTNIHRILGYTGTWIPPDLGLALAQQYGVDNLLKPIIDYVPPKGGSPPPAPKHVTAAPKGPRQKRTSTPAGAGTPRTNSMPPPPPLSAGTSTTGAGGRTPPTSARSTGRGNANSMNAAASSSAAKRSTNNEPHQLQQQQQAYYAESQLSQVEQYDESIASAPLSLGSETSRTPSPLASEAASEYSQYPHMQQQTQSSQQRRKRKHRDSTMGMEDQQQQIQQQQQQLQQQGMQMQHQQQQQGGQAATAGGPAAYARAILDYYISESASIPSFLISPPADFDPNVVIDDDGHTALHWACAMGRLRIVKLLLTAGADIFRANAIGQTALMRSVMFTNNYDLRKFPEMFELLHRSTINIDRTDRTVFHYAVDLALTKGKPHAAKYYLEVLLDRLKEYPKEVADILNFQDEEGETALTLAARARFKSLVKILLNYGADPKIANRDGKSAEDYILEDERFRHQNNTSSSSVIDIGNSMQQQQPYQQQQQIQYQQQLQPLSTTLPPGMDPQLQQPQRLDGQRAVSSAYPQSIAAQQPIHPNGYYQDGQNALAPQPVMPMVASAAVQTIPLPLHYSETGQRVTNQLIPQMNHQFEVLASTYDSELESKERDISQAHSLLTSIQAESVEHSKFVNLLKTQADQLEEIKAKEDSMRKELNDRMGKRFRLGWEKYVRDEEERQKAFVGITKNTNNGVKGIQQYSIELNESAKLNGTTDSKDVKTRSSSSTSTAEGGIPADIKYIFSNLPLSTEELSSEITTNIEKLDKLKTQRKELFDTLIQLQAEAGGDKITEYRKLIALGCGITTDEVTPDFVKSVLEQLDNGDDLAMVQILGEGEASNADEDAN